jgi:hypothetical protein
MNARTVKLFLSLLAGGVGLSFLDAQDAPEPSNPPNMSYVVVDTGQRRCFDNTGRIAPSAPGQAFFGQDAQYDGPTPRYRDNGDGTVSDVNTGLMWVRARGETVTWDDAVAQASRCRVGGYDDWRMPTIKELYSLIQFDGGFHRTISQSKPYLDTEYFEFAYGDTVKGERPIDCQDWSATEYIGKTMNGNATVFGVNFADGRIKGYPKSVHRPRQGGEQKHTLYVRYVRGNPQYGQNQFHDNGDGTVIDRATGLVWTKADSGRGMNWQDALAYAESLSLAGKDDWRLPNAKELQSIADYTRIPSIDPIFEITRLADGEYPFFWTSTTHLDGPLDRMGQNAVYIAFGRATGWMSIPPGRGRPTLMDVHGAGAQRSDPKVGDPSDFPQGRGPQGDVIRILNYVRCVRNATAEEMQNTANAPATPSPFGQ